MLQALEQSTVTIKFPVSCSVRALSATWSTLSGSDPRQPHLSADFLQQRPPPPHAPYGDEASSCCARANRPTTPPRRGKTRLHQELQELGRERVRFADDSPQEGCEVPNNGRQVREPLAVVSGPRWEALAVEEVDYHLVGLLVIRAPGGSIFSFNVGDACSTAAAAGTATWSLAAGLASSVLHVSSFTPERNSARLLLAVPFIPPAWRHADDARSSFASSEASWVAFRWRESPRLVMAAVNLSP